MEVRVGKVLWSLEGNFGPKELKSFFREALGEPADFDLTEKCRDKLITVASNLLGHGRGDIFKAVTAKALEDNPGLIRNRQKLEEKVLSIMGAEMGKLALYFKQLNKELEPLVCGALCMYLTQALKRAGLAALSLEGESVPLTASFKDAEEAIKRYRENEFNKEEFKSAVSRGALSGLTLAEIEALRRYSAGSRFNLKLNAKTIAIGAAVAAVLILFAVFGS